MDLTALPREILEYEILPYLDLSALYAVRNSFPSWNAYFQERIQGQLSREDWLSLIRDDNVELFEVLLRERGVPSRTKSQILTLAIRRPSPGIITSLLREEVPDEVLRMYRRLYSAGAIPDLASLAVQFPIFYDFLVGVLLIGSFSPREELPCTPALFTLHKRLLEDSYPIPEFIDKVISCSFALDFSESERRELVEERIRAGREPPLPSLQKYLLETRLPKLAVYVSPIYWRRSH